MTCSNGTHAVGEFFDDKLLHGAVVKLWQQGGWYTGRVKNYGFEGNGTFIWNNGRKYVGEFRDGKMNGKGIVTMGTRTLFEGIVRNNYYWTGFGEQRIRGGVGGGYFYRGHIENGRFHGPGRLVWDNGTKFIGWWSENVFLYGIEQRADNSSHMVDYRTPKNYSKYR